MTKQVQRRRGTATQHTSFTGAEGELSVNTTNKSVHVHDNVTAGGFEAARADMDNVTSSSILTAAGITATTTELNYVDGVTSAIQTQLDGKADTASPTFTGTLTTANLTATGTTTLAGASTSADITFGDNDKAIFGAGSDLSIYHDGSNSYIWDAGDGLLQLRTNGSRIEIVGQNGSEYMARFEQDGAVKLYYDNASKFATTSSGVDITGTAVTDGVTVAGNLSVDGGTIKLDGNYPTGTGNVALGDTALDDGSLSGGYNVAIGASALTANTTGTANVAVGANALNDNSTGIRITAVGREALANNTTGNHNTGIGYQAMVTNTTGNYNVSVGYESLNSNTTGNNNTAVGYHAGYSNTADNVSAFGHNALYSNTTGTQNIALGNQALYSNTTGSVNLASGYQALYSNTTASNNTAMGYQAGYSNTTGAQNTALGLWALKSNTTASNNTALGGGGSGVIRAALELNTTGANNTAVGTGALGENTTASNNTAVGYQAGYTTSTGDSNTFVGEDAGYSTVGNRNTFVGREAGRACNLAATQQNTFVGTFSGRHVTSGAKNTIIGAYNGNEGGLDIRTSSNNIVLSDGDGNPRVLVDASGNLIVGDNSAGGITSGGKFYATPSSGIYAAANADNAAYFNRNGGDGSIVEFRAGNTPVGSIGATSGDLYIGEGDTGLKFDAEFEAIVPFDTSTLANRDQSIDLGSSNPRFRDLYLSGGVYLGGVGSSNKLEDYEEGTYTPQFVSGTYSYGTRTGNYTKVGNLVSVNVMIQWSASSSGGNFLAIELPFTVGGASTFARYCGSIGYMSGVDTTTSYKQIAVTTSGSTTAVNFYQINDNSAPTSLTDSSLSSSGEFQMSITYQTT